MPSLSTLLLTLGAAALTLAAPSPNPPSTLKTSPSTPFTLSKRTIAYQSSNDCDYCGEAVPQYTFDAAQPLAADCVQITKDHPGPGFWTIPTSATLAAGPERWVTLAASGTCAFQVQQDLWETEVVEYQFGTNDLGFYVRSHASTYQAQDGRVGVTSSVYCRRYLGGDPTKSRLGYLDWRVAHT
ncbi:hypothetical protein C8A05DRAFT_37122 [Staphylotrichum tortipilum]|uniref:Ecp2 effector protein-like domain-containing protein n=1 Tax=Staphylotrichum tortipilum TaxID=2831512 RepID=A0AAN6RQP0_9PEZI|nr:hypothetical protein C8A05DRAFT_37122 [Staphylotrichum longicolle]